MLYTLHMCHATHDSDPLNPTHNPPRPAATSKPSGCAHKAALKTLRSQVTRLRSQGQAALKAALTRQAALTTLRSQDCAHKTALTRLRSQDCAHKAALTRLRMIEGSGFSIVVFRTGQLLSSLPIIRFLLHCFQNALVNEKIL